MKNFVGILTLLFGIGLGMVHAQIYPVNSNLAMPFPHSAFLFDYYQPGATNMQVTIQLNDFTVASQDVKLQFEIEKDNIRIATKANYQPLSPIVMTPGVPLILQGSDLYNALNSNNLEMEGLSAAAFNQNGGKLPEGQYNFCVKVLDYNSGKELSLPACAHIFVQMEQPPQLMTPECGTYIAPSTPQVLRFNWQVQGQGQPSFFGLNTYILHLYQITDPAITDPQNAVLNSKAVKVYESQPTSQNSLTLDFSTVLLVPGQKYVCRMQGIGPQGRQTFLNEGYSEWCWFNYGYPDDGVIELQEPYDGRQFEKTDQKVFSWGVSDKGSSGQSYDYKIVMVELTDSTQDLADALANNTSYKEETLPTTSAQDGANYQLTDDLEADKLYAWKIEAYSGPQKVAESEGRKFYSHSLIDFFYASNQKIKVVQTGNADLDNFAGKARIPLSEDETDFIDVNFDGLKIREVAGQMVLTEGEINFDLADRDEMEIEAENEVNGIGNFEYLTGKIDKFGLKVDGKIKWLLPHAVSPGEATEVIGKASTFILNADGQLSGESAIEPFYTILLAPKDFELSLKETSKLQLSENKLVINAKGNVVLPEAIRTKDNERVTVTFNDYQSTLDYIEIPNMIGAINGGVAPIGNLSLEFLPIGKGVLDLSEDESPAKLSADKSWKGFYVEEFKTRLNVANFDPTNQITLPERLDIDQTTENTSFRFWVGGTGLNLKTEFEFEQLEGLRFNNFQTELFKAEFDIRDSQFKTVKFSGNTLIPFIDEDDVFEFEIPTTETGLEQGFINDLEDREFIYNPYGGENRMDITINRVAFVDNEYLSLNVDILMDELEANIEGLEDLRVYGDNIIGVGGRNASVALDEPVTGFFKNLEVSITEVGAAFAGGNYAMSLTMESFLSEGFVDAEDSGPPTFSLSSVAPTTAVPAAGVSIPAPEIEVPEGLEEANEIQPTGFDVSIETPVLDCGAYLLFYQDDPTWGTRFAAGVNAGLKLPAAYNLGGNMTLGFVDGMDYWYFDAYFEDVTGTGIQVMVPYVGKVTNIVGVEGQVFRHVKAKPSEDGEFELELSPETQFGAKMFMQFIDPYANGFLYQADLGLEAEIQGPGFTVENFEVILSGQASFLNLNFRTGSSANAGTALAVLESAGVADVLIDQVFPQSVEIAGKQITLDSEGLSKGSSIEIGSVEGGEGILLGAKVSSKPGLEIGLAKDGYKFYGMGDAAGSAELGLEIPGMKLDAALENKTKGRFGLEVGDLTTHFSGDYVKKKVDFDFEYDNVSLELGVDKSQTAGNFNIKVDDTEVGAHANMAQKTAGVILSFDDKHFEVDYDGNELASNFLLEYGDFTFHNQLNLAQKRGYLLLETSVGEVEIEGSPQNALFRAESGQYLFHVESEFAARTGKLAIEFPNHELRGELKSDRGEVFMKKDNFEIGLKGKYDGTGGDLHVKEGDFLFDLGADVTESTGYLTFAKGATSFASRYDLSDTSFVRYADATNIFEAKHKGAFQGARIKTADTHFILELNHETFAGRTRFEIPSFLVATEFDATNDFASSNLEIGDHAIDSYIKDDSLAINYKNGGLDLQVAGTGGGNGRVYFADASQDLATGFSFDVENEAGSILFHKDDLSVEVAGNKSANTGLIDLQYQTNLFKGGINDSIYVATSIDDYGFSAMRSSSKIATSFSYADNKISVAKLTNGESLRLAIPDNTFGLSREGSSFSADYATGDLAIDATVGSALVEFDVKQGDKEIGASANDQKQVTASYKEPAFEVGVTGDLTNATYSTAITKGDWTGTVGTALSQKEVSLGLSKGDIGVDGAFTVDAKTLEYEVGDFKVSGGIVSSKPEFDIALGTAEFEFGPLLEGVTGPSLNGIADGGLQFHQGDVAFSMGNLSAGASPDFNINLGSTNFTIAPVTAGNACQLDVTRGTTTLPYVGNTIDETINGNRLKVVLNADSSKNILVETSDVSVDVAYKCGELPEIAVNQGGKQYVFKVKSDEVALIYEDNEFTFVKSNNELTVKKGSEYSFKVNNEALESDLDGYYLNASESAFSAGTGDTYLELSEDQVSIHADERFVELHKDNTYILQVEENKNLAATPTSLELNVDSKRLFVNETSMSAADTEEAFAVAVAEDSLSIQKGNHKVFASQNLVKFNSGSDYVSVSDQVLAAKYDDKEVAVSADKKVTYSDNSRALEASKESLMLDYEGKVLQVAADQVSISLAPNQKFMVKEDLLSAEYDQYKVELKDPLTTPGFAYSDDNNSLSLSESELAILIDGKGVSVNEEKLQFNYDDNFLSFTENDMAFQYDRYTADFTDWSAVHLSNGVQEFAIDQEELYAAIDASNSIRAGITAADPRLELIHDDTRLGIATDGAEFDYDGMHYALGTEEYIRVNEIGKENEGFVFSEKGITYQMNETRSLTVAPKDDLVKLDYDNTTLAFDDKYALRFEVDDYVTKIKKDLSVTFVAKGEHSVELNQPDYMVGYTYLPLDCYMRLKRFDDNYIGLLGGVDKYAGFVKPAEDKSIEIGGIIDGLGQASVTVNQKKDIGIKLQQSADNLVKVGIEKAKNLSLAHVRVAGLDILNFGGDADVFGEQVEGIAAVGGDGPAHIATISEKAMGWATGGIKFRATVGKDAAFVAQGRMKTGISIPVMCGNAPFGAEITPGKFRFKVGEKNDYAGFSLLCLPGISLAREEGYADIGFDGTGNAADLHVGVGYKISTGFKGGFSVDVGPCDLGVSVDVGAHLHFGGEATMTVPYGGGSPDFTLGPIFAELHAHASLSADACFYSFSASASITGRLELTGGTDGGEAEGTASGHMSVAGLNKDFSFNAKVKI